MPFAGDQWDLSQLLRDNPAIHAAWVDRSRNPTRLHIEMDTDAQLAALRVPAALAQFRREIVPATPFRAMFLPAYEACEQNQWTACQNEPVRLGCQIQPRAQAWVGTAGAPVKWQDNAGKPHWGVLSNWHVMVPGNGQLDWPIHQPTDQQPAIARLSAHSAVQPGQANLIDAAIADALIDGKHTISNQILGIGALDPQPIAATVGQRAKKSGRTTFVVRGKCVATGASVRIGYGQFTALFDDQDVYQADAGTMSLPGDSGSLIVSENGNHPMSLLFGGGGNQTIGCPVRHIIKRFNLSFQL